MNILIVRPDAMGDVLLLAPMIATLKQHYPQSKLSLLVQPYTAPLYAQHPLVDTLLLDWKKQGKISSIFDFFNYVKFIKNQQFDVAILPHTFDFYVALTWAAGIKMRIGDGNKPLLRPFLTHPVPVHYRNLSLHETQHNLSLLKPLGITEPNETFQFAPATEAEKITLNHLLITNGWKNDQPLVALHPSTGGSNRAWGITKYAQLAHKIQTQTPYRVVLTGAGEKDSQIANEVQAACPSALINLAGKTDIPLLKTLTQHLEAFISTDTGPMHLAALYQVPIVCLSPTKFVKPLCWGPFNTVNRVVRNTSTCPLACNPWVCKESFCTEAIGVDSVFEHFKAVLTQSPLSSTQQLHEWFKVSTQVGLFVPNPGDLAQATAFADFLKAAGIRVSISTQKPWQWRKLIQWITQNDIGIVHTFGYSVPFFGLIRALAAPNMYVPPVLVTEPWSPLITQDQWLETYLDAFRKQGK